MMQILGSNVVNAKDFGKVGTAFPIKEEGLLSMIQRRLQQVDIAYHNQKMLEVVKEKVLNPKPVIGIKHATKSREFYYDPTYILDKDVMLPCGTVLYRAGTKVNSLEYMDFARRLLFIDASSKQQVDWLKIQLASVGFKQKVQEGQEAVEDRIILVKGSVFNLQEQLGSLHVDKVYFDQAGVLTNKFGIKFVPAVVVQEGKQLKIMEIVIDEQGI